MKKHRPEAVDCLWAVISGSSIYRAKPASAAILAKQSCNLVANYRQRIGASTPDALDAIDYRMMREQAWSERLSERGLA